MEAKTLCRRGIDNKQDSKANVYEHHHVHRFVNHLENIMEKKYDEKIIDLDDKWGKHGNETAWEMCLSETVAMVLNLFYRTSFDI